MTQWKYKTDWKADRTAEKDSFQPSGQPFNRFYALFYTADPDPNQDPASLRCCLYKWSLHYSLSNGSMFAVWLFNHSISVSISCQIDDQGGVSICIICIIFQSLFYLKEQHQLQKFTS